MAPEWEHHRQGSKPNPDRVRRRNPGGLGVGVGSSWRFLCKETVKFAESCEKIRIESFSPFVAPEENVKSRTEAVSLLSSTVCMPGDFRMVARQT